MTHATEGPAPEREGEFDRALRLLMATGSVSPGVVLVTGPRGIGKSRFARDLLDRLPSDLPRLTGSGSLQASPDPLLPWVRVLRRLARSRPGGPAATLLPALQDRRPAPTALLVDDIVDTLADEFRAAPFVVLLDDVERFDPAALAVLEAVCACLPMPPAAVVACFSLGAGRTQEATAVLASLTAQQSVEHIGLRPLSDHAVHRLMDAHSPGRPRSDRARLVRLSLGNPQLAIELARAGGDAFAAAPGSMLGLMLAEQAGAVDDHHVLTALALVGRPATVLLLAAATDVSATTAARIVEAAAAAGVLQVSGVMGVARFVDPVVESAVRANVDAAVAGRLHHRLAALVAPAGLADGPGLVERARHLLAAGDPTDDTAQACLVACLYEERRGSSGMAEDLARNGLDVPGAKDETRVGLHRALARLSFAGGHTRRGIDEARQAVAIAQRCERAVLVDAVTDLAWVDPRVLDVEPGRRALYEDALADPSCTLESRAIILGRRAFVLTLPDLEAARAAAQESVALAEQADSQRATEAARAAWFIVTYRLDAAELVKAEGVRLTRLGDDRAAANAVFATALATGDRSLVDVMVEQVAREPDRLGLIASRRMLDGVQLGLAVSDGDAEAVHRLAATIAEFGNSDLQSFAMPLIMLWYSHTGLDVPLPRPFAVTAPSGSDLGRYAALAMGATEALLDRSTDPASVASVASLAEPRALLMEATDGPFADLVPALAALVGDVLDDPQLCMSAVQRLARHEDRFLLLLGVVPIAPVGWLTAWAHARLGDRRAALRANEAAISLARSARFDLWTAQCMLQRADLLAHAAPAASSAAARTALGIAQAKGLRRLADRAQAAIAATGEAASPISPTQEETLRLAASGLTNDGIARRLGVSVSMVEKHLTQVYRRLGLPNRAAAVRWYSDRPTP